MVASDTKCQRRPRRQLAGAGKCLYKCKYVLMVTCMMPQLMSVYADVDQYIDEILKRQTQSGQLSSFKAQEVMESYWELSEEIYAKIHRRQTDKAASDSNQSMIGFYRIIGSPLPPRHGPEQLWTNLKYIVEKEPVLEGAHKIFVLNRILPKSLEATVQDYLLEHGFEVMVISFDAVQYRPYQATDSYGLGAAAWGFDVLTETFSRLNANLYIINNNGARNHALLNGIRRGYRWVLPFDGNCFFDRQSWEAMRLELGKAGSEGRHYAAIPMLRSQFDNSSNLQLSKELGEPQVAFANSARLIFDPTQMYGHRSKVSLLWRLNVKGAWSRWKTELPFRIKGVCHPFRDNCFRRIPQPHPVEAELRITTENSFVIRLPDHSNQTSMAYENIKSLHERGLKRSEAVKRRIDYVDAVEAPSAYSKRPFVKPVFYNVFSMEHMRRECLAIFDLTASIEDDGTSQTPPPDMLRHTTIPSSLTRSQHHCDQIRTLVSLAEFQLQAFTPPSPVDKKKSAYYKPPPGATEHDYQRLGLYDWRVSELPLEWPHEASLPMYMNRNAHIDRKLLKDEKWRRAHKDEFVIWDGHAREDSVLWSEAAAAYDRSRAWDSQTNLTLMALAFFYTGDVRYAEKAVATARTWWLDPATAQSPHLKFADFSRPEKMSKSGLISMKDLAYTLDALTLVSRANVWSDEDAYGMQRWCTDYLEWMHGSPERQAVNNHRWWYTVQYIAVARCANKTDDFLLEEIRDLLSIVLNKKYIKTNGILPLEAKRSRSVHYHAFTLYAMILVWRALVNLGTTSMKLLPLKSAIKWTTTLLDEISIAQNGTTSIQCISYDSTFEAKREQKEVSAELARRGVNNADLKVKGCVSRKLLLEYAPPICQWAYDADPAFASNLSMCRLDSAEGISSPMSALGTPTLLSLRTPPLFPKEPHFGYFTFTNLMW